MDNKNIIKLKGIKMGKFIMKIVRLLFYIMKMEIKSLKCGIRMLNNIMKMVRLEFIIIKIEKKNLKNGIKMDKNIINMVMLSLNVLKMKHYKNKLIIFFLKSKNKKS